MLALTACGGKSQGGTGEKPSSLIIATGGTAGTYYPLGGGIANLLKDKAGTNATAQVTGAAVENMRLISKKEVDLAITQGDIADYAAKGSEMFQEGAVGNLQAIGALYQETIQIVVSEKSGIRSVSELKGKKVSVGAPGSGTEVNARQILEIYGLTFDDLSLDRLSFGDSAKKIQDGGLDAAFVTAGAPTAAINELAATTGIRILSIEDDKIQAIIDKYKYYNQQIIAGGTYPKQNAEVKTVAVKAIMSVRAELDTQLVYDITKAIYENTQPLIAINAKAKEINADQALEGISIPLHPGAEKYLKEKGVIS
ncbi:TAXI family TRAP transporter solute-binding subunit [Cohnella sp. CFH 77786]|nr:TAXI family TRAP transporter solute-binding subunit [Cohnella sp. CFH 77786]